MAEGKLGGALQENTLTLLCFSDKYHTLARNAIEPELFTTYLYRDIVARVHTYIDQFKKPPKLHLPDICEDLLKERSEKGEATRSLLQSVYELAEHLDEEYVVSQLEQFTRQQRMKLGIIEAARHLEHGELDEAEQTILEAMKGRMSLFDSGVTLEDVYSDLLRPDNNEDRVLTGIPELDINEFGPTRKELLLFLAPFGTGKTWWLIHLMKRALMQQWRVCYITLEAHATKVIGRRLLQGLFSFTKRQGTEVMLTSVEDDEGDVTFDIERSDEWPSLSDPKGKKDLGKKLKKLRIRKNVRIKQFPTSQLTYPGLVAYLDGLEAQERFKPDLLLIDYPKLMKLDPNNLRVELGALNEKLRGLAVERNMALATVHQFNREGIGAKMGSEQHVSEDISMVGTADQIIFMNQTQAEYELGLARLFVDKGRNERAKYSVLITQAYSIGQFVTNSLLLPTGYWAVLERERQRWARGGSSSDDTEEGG